MLVEIPPGRDYGAFSIMEGEKVLAGVARWANHSCRPNMIVTRKEGSEAGPVLGYAH